MLFTLPCDDISSVLNISVTAQFSNTSTASFPGAVKYYMCSDNDLIDSVTAIDESDNIRKFVNSDAVRKYINRYKGLDDRTDDYVVGRVGDIPAFGGRVTKTFEFDVSKIKTNERGEFVIIIKKDMPDSSFADLTDADLNKMQTYQYPPTLTVKYVVK